MLTGDKVDTATCIAISAGFKSNKEKLFYMRELTDVSQAYAQLGQFSNKAKETVLMIDGQTVDLVLSNE